MFLKSSKNVKSQLHSPPIDHRHSAAELITELIGARKSIMSKLTYFLLVLVAGTIIFSAVRHPNPITTATAGQKNRDDYKKINERFPTADYNDKQDLPDPEKNAKRKEKQNRYNDTDLVATHVEPGVDEAALFLEPHFNFPALPVAESEIVVVGTIGTAQALLSENKRNGPSSEPLRLQSSRFTRNWTLI